MNQTAFYKGILAELHKQAVEMPTSAPAPVEKKKNNWMLPALGVGGAALGAGLLYNKFKSPSADPNQFAPKPYTEDVGAPRPMIDKISDKAGIGAMSAGTGQGAYNLAGSLYNKWFGGKTGLPGQAHLNKIPMNRIGGGVDLSYGVSDLNSAVNNPYGENGVVRAAQGVSGISRLGLGVMGAANKTVNAGFRTAAEAWAGKAAAGKLMAGTIGMPATIAALVAQVALENAGNHAEGHSDELGSMADQIPMLRKYLRSNDPVIKDKVKQIVNSWFDNSINPGRGSDFNVVTNPDGWARIGSGIDNYGLSYGNGVGVPWSGASGADAGTETITKAMQNLWREVNPTYIPPK